MPVQATDPTDHPDPIDPSPAAGLPPAPVTRRRARKCRTCGQPSPTALVRGECPSCAGFQPLPLRDAGGRFLTLHAEPTRADAYAAKYAAKGGGR